MTRRGSVGGARPGRAPIGAGLRGGRARGRV